MDAKQAALEQKLAKILTQAARVGAAIQGLEQGPGTPHYDQIEGHAHEAGQRLSQLMQQTRLAEVTAEQPPEINCPRCGGVCRVKAETRPVLSEDGPVELVESVTRCSRCRRAFFPSA